MGFLLISGVAKGIGHPPPGRVVNFDDAGRYDVDLDARGAVVRDAVARRYRADGEHG
jgi:hypothetical protein